MRVDVMEFDEGPLAASPPTPANECTGTAVTQPDRAPHLGRDIPAARSGAVTGPWSLRGCELLARHVFEQRRQRAIDDLCQVSSRDGVPEQVLGQA